MSWIELVAVLACGVVGATVQGSIGIGLTLLVGPALVAIDPAFTPAPLLISTLAIHVRHAVVERAAVDRAVIRRSLLGLPVGIGLGLVFVATAEPRLRALVFGAFAVVASLALLAGFRIERRPTTDVVGGALISASSVAASLPGPAAVVTYNDLEPRALRGTIGTFAGASSVVSLIGLTATGVLTTHELGLAARLFPGVLVGLAVASRVRHHLDRTWFRPVVLGVACAGGLALVIRTLAAG